MHIHIDPNSPLGRIILVVGAPLYATLFWFELQAFIRAFRSRHWPVGAGEIVHSQLEDIPTMHGTHKKAKVRYAYTIAGERRESKTIAFGVCNESIGRGSARKAVERYPKGSQVRVHYNPERPQVCCLEPGWPGLLDTFALFFSIVGVFLGSNVAADYLASLL
jgi:hypothetical protein